VVRSTERRKWYIYLLTAYKLSEQHLLSTSLLIHVFSLISNLQLEHSPTLVLLAHPLLIPFRPYGFFTSVCVVIQQIRISNIPELHILFFNKHLFYVNA